VVVWFVFIMLVPVIVIDVPVGVPVFDSIGVGVGMRMRVVGRAFGHHALFGPNLGKTRVTSPARKGAFHGRYP
jgi:hypothetical protein